LIPPPASESLANVLGIQIERVADVLERKDPGVVVRIEPLARFAEKASPASVRGKGISLVAPDCFF